MKARDALVASLARADMTMKPAIVISTFADCIGACDGRIELETAS